MPNEMQVVQPEHRRERAVLVGVEGLSVTAGEGRVPTEESLEELRLLSDTAGAEVVDTLVQRRNRIHPATFVGRGFADRIARHADGVGADLVVFDEDLSPAQVRNLGRIIPLKIVDRSGLILDIFAERAKTRETRTQVELAQLEYLLPRLTRAWTHLSRQVGGIGTRGPGETQLEVDRRLVRTRIAELHKELERIERQRTTQREGRREFFQATLVGYTNAGKSTLLNRLADAHVFVEDRLFATLDATTRAVELSDQARILVTDTVGFIRKLPPGLVASFRSTLEEAVVADLLIHVVDISHPWYEDHITSANRVLEDLGILAHPTLMVFNKTDRVDARAIDVALGAWPGAVPLSAADGSGLDLLAKRLTDQVRRGQIHLEMVVPHARPDLVNAVHELGTVLERVYDADGVRLVVRAGEAMAGRLKSLVAGVPGASVIAPGSTAKEQDS